MYLCDRTEIENNTSSDTLMLRAAHACADEIRSILGTANTETDTENRPAHVLILCGSGNNGGDGILCARLLRETGIAADICTSFDGEGSSPADACRLQHALDAGVRRVPLTALTDPEADPSYDLIADALIGIGLHGEITGVTADIIDAANTYAAEHRIPTVAIDMASGIDADTGKTAVHTFRASHTLAINNAKRGHLLYPGAACTGALRILDIAIPEAPLDIPTDGTPRIPVFMLTDRDAKTLLPARRPDAHKGSCGRILIVAGSLTICGAAYLSALGAYRTGAGMVEIFTPKENRIPLQTLLPEAIINAYDNDDLLQTLNDLGAAIKRASAIVIGPGIGTGLNANAMLDYLLRAATVPTVLDADALTILADSSESWLQVQGRRLKKQLLTDPHTAHDCVIEEENPEDEKDDASDDGTDETEHRRTGCLGIPSPDTIRVPKSIIRDSGISTDVPPFIMTPHPREMSHLSGRKIEECLANPIGTATVFAGIHKIILNAKNARSVITDGNTAYLNPTGTAALAKGGSGDVLTGITATLCAQGCDPLKATALAAYIHGRAAEIVTSRMGDRAPLASEIADAIGEAILQIEATV